MLFRIEWGRAVLIVGLVTGLLAPAAAQDCGDLFDPGQLLNVYVTMDKLDAWLKSRKQRVTGEDRRTAAGTGD